MSYILNDKDIIKHETVERPPFRITTTVYGQKAVLLQITTATKDDGYIYTEHTVFLEDGKA